MELHLPHTKAHVRNHCTILRFLSHEVGAKYFLEGYGNPGWGQNMESLGWGVKEFESYLTGNGELWRMPEEGSDVVSKCLVVVPQGLCSRLASSPQPRQLISLA